MMYDVCMDGCLLRRISRTGLPPRCKGGGETTSERGQQQHQHQHQGRSVLGCTGAQCTAYSVQCTTGTGRAREYLGNLQREALSDMTDGNRTRMYVL